MPSTHGPAAFTVTRASTSTASPSTSTSAPHTFPSAICKDTTSARLSTTAPASAAATTFSRQSRASFVQASA